MRPSTITDLTLLLAYLTSWDERLRGTRLRRAWRGYDFEALDRLHASGDVSFARADLHPLTDLASEHLVFDPQILDLADQIALDGFAQELK